MCASCVPRRGHRAGDTILELTADRIDGSDYRYTIKAIAGDRVIRSQTFKSEFSIDFNKVTYKATPQRQFENDVENMSS